MGRQTAFWPGSKSRRVFPSKEFANSHCQFTSSQFPCQSSQHKLACWTRRSSSSVENSEGTCSREAGSSCPTDIVYAEARPRTRICCSRGLSLSAPELCKRNQVLQEGSYASTPTAMECRSACGSARVQLVGGLALHPESRKGSNAARSDTLAVTAGAKRTASLRSSPIKECRRRNQCRACHGIRATAALTYRHPKSVRLIQCRLSQLKQKVSINVQSEQRRVPVVRASMSENLAGAQVAPKKANIPTAADTVRAFYSSINKGDIDLAMSFISEDCRYEDMIYKKPFIGQKVRRTCCLTSCSILALLPFAPSSLPCLLVLVEQLSKQQSFPEILSQKTGVGDKKSVLDLVFLISVGPSERCPPYCRTISVRMHMLGCVSNTTGWAIIGCPGLIMLVTNLVSDSR
jgi:hypothetical protein